MKKIIIFIMLMMTFLLIFVGCSKKESVANKNKANNTVEEDSINKKDNNVEQSTDLKNNGILSEEDSEANEIVDKNKTKKDDNENKQSNSKKENKDKNIEVIAKSNSSVSNKEKEEILNEINKLLDDTLSNINEMDSVEDEDLEIEE